MGVSRNQGPGTRTLPEGPLNLRSYLDYCQAHLADMLRCLRQAVEIESPTSSKPDVDRMAGFFAREFERSRATVRMLRHPTAGTGIVAEFWGKSTTGSWNRRKPFLLLGHLDTVWDAGTLSRMPFRISKGRAYGPGILDMKSGIVIGLWAIRALQAAKFTPSSPVRFF